MATRFLSLCILLIVNNYQASAKSFNFYSDIPIVFNTDSLEKSLVNTKLRDDTYYNTLLTLEKSRETFRSCFIGKYADEIEQLSRRQNNQWGIAYSNYLKVLRNLIILKGNTFDNTQLAEQTLAQFEQLQDSEAAFLTHMLVVNCHRLQLNKYGLFFEKEDYLNIAQKTRNETIKLIEPHLNYCTVYAQTCSSDLYKIKYYIFKLSLWNTLWLNVSSNDSALALCDKIFRLTGKNNDLSFFNADVLNLKGNIFFRKDSLDLTIKFHLEALKFIVNNESNLNILLNSNIGNEYFLNGQPEKGYPYLIKCIENNNRLGNLFPASSSLAYQFLANDYYAALHTDYKSAYHCLDSFIKITEPINNQSRLDEFRNFMTQQDLSEKIQRAKILELKNRQSKQGLIAVSLIIILLGLILAGVIRSRKKLRDAYRQIQELQHSREKFYSIVAHDLKSPLSSYQGLANTISYLIKKKDYEQIEKISQKIDDNGAKIQMMLQNLFQWSLSEQKNLQYKEEITTLAEVYKTILPVYHSLSEIKNLGILELIDFDGKIKVDPNYLSTVIRNLLDNAVKNSPSGTIIQFISVKENNEIVIRIVNAGILKKPDYTSMLNFFNSDKPFSPGEQGIGLGLILVREFTKTMKGKITLTTTKNEVTFSLRLPL